MNTSRRLDPGSSFWEEFCFWLLIYLRAKGCIFSLKFVHFFRMFPLRIENLALRLRCCLLERKKKFASLSIHDRRVEFISEVNQVLDGSHDRVLGASSVCPNALGMTRRRPSGPPSGPT